MLAKKYRLPIQEFIGRRGNQAKTGFFILKSFPPEKDYRRLGAVISGKVLRKSTPRNRLRRTIFDFFTRQQKTLPVKDYLIIVLAPVARLQEEELKRELEKIFI